MPEPHSRLALRLTGIGALEKFSFNAIRAMLVLYLAHHWRMSDARAFEIYGLIIGLAFVTPVIGGVIADRFTGNARMLVAGAVISAAGVFALLGASSLSLYVGLGLVVVGSGCLKASMPTLIGRLTEGRPRQRESLYALLYLGFNVGTFLGTIGCAAVGELFGWRLGFLVAGGASVACAALAFSARRDLSAVDANRGGSDRSESSAGKEDTSWQWTNIAKLGGLMLVHTVFFALYERAALSLTLFTERNIDRSLGGSFEIPVTLFQGIDPVLNIVLGGLFVRVWTRLEERNINPGYYAKNAVGLLVLAAGLLLLAVPGSTSGRLPAWLLVVTYTLFVVGEQLAVPIGFAAVAALAPRRHLSLFMGLWMLSIGASVWLAGQLSILTGAGASGMDPVSSLAFYQRSFVSLSIVPAALGIALLAGPIIHRAMARRAERAAMMPIVWRDA
jgi:POT family proton-dependent oligopeptide transporter